MIPSNPYIMFFEFINLSPFMSFVYFVTHAQDCLIDVFDIFTI